VLRADVGGLSVAYERTGRGPALVLLHGFLFDSRAWRPQLVELGRDFTVIAWDAPGAGRSSDPPEWFRIGDWADCLAAFLDIVGVRSAHVVGLSWGGLLAQELFRRDRIRLRSLVLADTYAGWRGSLPSATAEERFAECLRDSSLPADEVVSRYQPGMHSGRARPDVQRELASIMSDFHPAGFRLMARSLAESDTRNLLADIDVPTLLLWGDADLRSPLSVAREMQGRIPGASLAVIPNAGHVSNLEAPAHFNAQIRAFCLRGGDLRAKSGPKGTLSNRLDR
jgi:pimeloyl-ACP methyl ester carboxylesterase